jgi:hypothetical protein
MNRHLPLFVILLLLTINASSQIVILKNNPSNAYAALVSSPNPTSSGPNPVDLVGAAWTSGGSPGGWRTFFKLNDSALSGIIIDSAIMQLYADPASGLGFTGSPTYGTNNTCVLYRVTSPWATSINWLTMPAYSAVDSVVLPLSTSTVQNYLHLDVTNVLNDIVTSGLNYGFMLKSRQEGTYYNSMIFNSSSALDSTKRPQILVYGHLAIHPFYFAGGHTQSLNICVNEAVPLVSINSLLAVVDSVTGEAVTWSAITPPMHGAVMAAYTTTSTGGTLTPTGLSYTPTSGYLGSDVFKVKAAGTAVSDTVTVNVVINPYPDAGTISGIDSVCPGLSVPLSETVGGGIWSTSSFTVSHINSSGMVQGLVPGSDTIIYTVSNSCGITSVLFPFFVRSYYNCHTGVNTLLNNANNIEIYPNPAHDKLNVSAISQIGLMSIADPIGKVVFSHEYNDMQAQVSISALAKGVYFININGSVIKKFVKE